MTDENNTQNLEELGRKFLIQKKKQYEYQRKYMKRRYHNDSVFRRKCILKRTISCTLSTYSKNPIAKRLTYTIKDLIQHLEQQFTNDMTWKNYGIYWELDHIRPLKTAKTEEEVIILFQLANLRPLEKKLNRTTNFL